MAVVAGHVPVRRPRHPETKGKSLEEIERMWKSRET